MTALELKAIRALPEDCIVDGLQFCVHKGWVVLANGRELIKWSEATGWTPVYFSEAVEAMGKLTRDGAWPETPETRRAVD